MLNKSAILINYSPRDAIYLSTRPPSSTPDLPLTWNAKRSNTLPTQINRWRVNSIRIPLWTASRRIYVYYVSVNNIVPRTLGLSRFTRRRWDRRFEGTDLDQKADYNVRRKRRVNVIFTFVMDSESSKDSVWTAFPRYFNIS